MIKKNTKFFFFWISKNREAKKTLNLFLKNVDLISLTKLCQEPSGIQNVQKVVVVALVMLYSSKFGQLIKFLLVLTFFFFKITSKTMNA